MPTLRIRGAHTHNLRQVDLDLPLGGLTVFVGPSGSGKSSLALDTVHALSRARLSSALGMALEGAGGPGLARVADLPVTLAVGDRHRPPGSARVMDVLGLAAPLAALGLAAGTVHCPRCDRALPTGTADQHVDTLLAEGRGQRLTLLAPLARARSGGIAELVGEIGRQGFARVRLDGVLHRVEEVPVVDARRPHDLDVVIDRLRPEPERRDRLEEAVGTALAAGQGRLVALLGENERVLAERPWCPDHPDLALEAMQAEWLAGGPGGRCRSCDGVGRQGEEPCASCSGTGLRDEVRHWRLGPTGPTWPELLARPLAELAAALGAADDSDPTWQAVGDLADAATRDGGLGHLPPARRLDSLSTSEQQRLLLVAALRTQQDVPGLLLVLDEPLAGLDPATAARPARLLAGSNALVVTHDRDLVERAAWCVAFGPGAGRRGGTVVWQGPGPELPTTLLPPDPTVQVPPPPPLDGPVLCLSGCTGTVLGGLDAAFPHGALTVVTGPAGSGKTTLLGHTLVPAVRRALGLVGPPPLPHRALTGLAPITQLLTFDRSPLGRSERSCVATVLGTWAPLRALLAATRDARILGFDASRFRFDRPGGRCEACQGTGQRQVEVAARGMLAEARSSEPCPVCGGHRFQRDTLRVRLKGRTVAQLLDTDLHEASELFAAHPKLGPPLLAARLVGLGYLPLGQASATLSGGEAQRLRLARELARSGGIGTGEARRLGDRLVVLDAPTVGLHPHDVGPVVDVLRRLADRGATVVAATLEPRLVAAADWCLELSPPRTGLRRSAP